MCGLARVGVDSRAGTRAAVPGAYQAISCRGVISMTTL